MPMPARLTEFGCGHSVRTGTQVISWIVLISCLYALQEINLYFYENKKANLSESPLTLILLNLTLGIYTSLCGLYGVYSGKRIWLKQFLIYLGCQFIFALITIWIYFVYIYPKTPPFPRRTRYMILTTILAAVVATGLISYAIAVVFSHYKDLGGNNEDDRQFLFSDEERGIFPITNGDQFPSNMSDISSVTSRRTYLTTVPNPNDRQRYVNAFAPTPIPEESQKTAESVSADVQIDFTQS